MKHIIPSFALAAGLGLATLLTPAVAQQTYPSSAGPLRIETIAKGLSNPWALQFLDDGRMLVTERVGSLRIVDRDGTLSPPVEGVPKVLARSQGGLLDVLLDRNFAQNRTLYLTYAEPIEGGGRTAVARATLDAGEKPRLSDVSVIFRQQGAISRGQHYGARIVQAKDGNLFVALGEHSTNREMAQKLDNHLGKVVRIAPDGSVPKDNPFVGKDGALPEIWSYGHRNPQGLAFNPADGKLWEQEHGAQGGDELNIVERGKNYGWPVVSHGVNYGGSPIGSGKAQAPGMQDPVFHWTPSIAPSGMTFYTGDLFPAWKGSVFNGGLKLQLLSRVSLKNDKAVDEERMLQGLGERIRDVRQGPDGALFLLTDSSNGRILRVTPAK